MRLPHVPGRFAAAIAVAAVTLAAFWPVLGNGFVNYDDPRYVTDNPSVQGGLSLHALLWALETTRAANWHPLTWVSHTIDWQLFDGSPRGHHLTSLLLHVANALLLYLVLDRMTGAPWRSALVAALFGVHPLHVESVAWVAERKDVLSTFFWFLTTWLYVGYARRPAPGPYVAVMASLALGLAAKPMLVTVPVTLLLLDVWPLGRWPRGGAAAGGGGGLRSLLVEKVPLLSLSGVSSAITLWAQHRGHAIGSLEHYPLASRVSNAVVSYVVYLRKTVCPSSLAVYYPYPHGPVAVLEAAGCAAALALATAAAWRLRRSSPYLWVGWLWYLVTLFPVIGLIQVGGQSMADRYTYVPLVGIFLIAAWGTPDLARIVTRGAMLRRAASGSPRRVQRRADAVLWIAVPVLVMVTRAQVAVWHDPVTLFTHALEVTERNDIAHDLLGVALADRGHLVEAASHHREALRINPGRPEAQSNLGHALTALGRAGEAVPHLREAVRLRPEFPEAHNNLGVALAALGRQDEAIGEYREALRLEPTFADALNNLGVALASKGQIEEGLADLEEAVRVRPDFAMAHRNVGRVLAEQGKLDDAIRSFERALSLEPGYADAHDNLGLVLARQHRYDEAVVHYLQAIRLDPKLAEAHNNLGAAHMEQGRVADARREFEEAVRIRPDYGKAHSNLAAALLLSGDYEGAREEIDLARRNGVEPPERLVDLVSRKARDLPAR